MCLSIPKSRSSNPFWCASIAVEGYDGWHTWQHSGDVRFDMCIYLSLGMLNQYSGFIFFFPYDMMGVVMPPLRFSGFPIRSLK
jgi:hypothetical protein